MTKCHFFFLWKERTLLYRIRYIYILVADYLILVLYKFVNRCVDFLYNLLLVLLVLNGRILIK